MKSLKNIFLASIAIIAFTSIVFPNIQNNIDKKIFITTVPKAGTGLLSKLIQLITNRESAFSKDIFELDPMSEINSQIFIVSHAIYKFQYQEHLTKNVKGLFLLRDPRDLIVSLAHWIKKTNAWPAEVTDLPMKQLISKLIHEARLIIFRTNKTSNTIDALYREDYLPWLKQEAIYTTYFEKLVGPHGGGTKQEQIQEIIAIANHCGKSISESEALSIASKSFGVSGGTFREGKIGSWKKHFTPQHKLEFKQIAGQLLIDLGYEKNLSW